MLNWVDVAILIVVGISAVFGISRGFVREVLSVLAWIAAIVVARLYSPHLAPFFTVTDNETARYALAFAVLCLITLIVGGIINHFMARLVSMVGLQMTDRLLGTLFGVARGVIIVAIVVYFAASSYSLELWWQESVAIPYIERVIEWGQSMLGSDPAAV
tara:strand:- start:244 stop:720 length:477 start_codon:yes stop_codon:yes gene_type:complete